MFYKAVCLFFREDITGGLMALRKVIPGGDTYMNLGLEMVRLGLNHTIWVFINLPENTHWALIVPGSWNQEQLDKYEVCFKHELLAPSWKCRAKYLREAFLKKLLFY